MVYVYYTTINEKIEGYKFERLLQQVPIAMQSQVLKYRKWQDRQRGLLGKLLLQRGLQLLGWSSYTLNDLKYNVYNRPYLDGKVDFNISHSGDYIVCAISENVSLGVDIEEIQDVPISDFDLQFSEKELDDISGSPEPFRQFFNYWTKKEAFLKAIGVGLNLPLNQLHINNNEIIWDGKRWFLQSLAINKYYVSHLCTDAIFPKTQVKNLYFD